MTTCRPIDGEDDAADQPPREQDAVGVPDQFIEVLGASDATNWRPQANGDKRG
jgi:hypothetical protein